MVQTILSQENDRKPLLDELGIKEKLSFVRTSESNIAKLEYSDTLSIAGDCKLQVADLVSINRDNARATGVFLSKTIQNRDVSVGYIVYTHSQENPSKAIASINYFKTRTFNSVNQNLSGIIHEVVEKSDPFDAFKVDPEFQGSGYGKALWLLGATYMESRGVSEIEIYGDITIGQQGDNQSFYTKAGAKVLEDGREVYDTSNVWNQRDYLERIINPPSIET